MVFRDTELYKECFEASGHKSHPPFRNGYYITEYGTILMVKEYLIYRLEHDGWVRSQNFADLWYGSLDDFCDIPSAIADRFGLDKYGIKPSK